MKRITFAEEARTGAPLTDKRIQRYILTGAYGEARRLEEISNLKAAFGIEVAYEGGQPILLVPERQPRAPSAMAQLASMTTAQLLAQYGHLIGSAMAEPSETTKPQNTTATI